MNKYTELSNAEFEILYIANFKACKAIMIDKEFATHEYKVKLSTEHDELGTELARRIDAEIARGEA